MNRLLRLTVLGTGYLGITHATCMASLGFEVLGVDTDPRKVDRLNAGDLPIYEPGLEELLHCGSRLRAAGFHHFISERRGVRRCAFHLRRDSAAACQSQGRSIPGPRVRDGTGPAA